MAPLKRRALGALAVLALGGLVGMAGATFVVLTGGSGVEGSAYAVELLALAAGAALGVLAAGGLLLLGLLAGRWPAIDGAGDRFWPVGVATFAGIELAAMIGGSVVGSAYPPTLVFAVAESALLALIPALVLGATAGLSAEQRPA